MHRLTFAVVVLVPLAGCVGPHLSGCQDFPMSAGLSFTWEGSNATMLDALAEAGWRVTPGENSLSFRAVRDHAGQRFSLGGGTQGLDPAGSVGVYLEGPRGKSTDEEARATLGPLIEEFEERFGATTFTVHGGSRHCGAV